MIPIKHKGNDYYELEDGSIVDKKLYDLALFLEEQQQKLTAIISQIRADRFARVRQALWNHGIPNFTPEELLEDEWNDIIRGRG